MAWKTETKFDNVISSTANGSALLYIIPAVIILVAIAILGVPNNYWTPILIIYGIGAITHGLAFGFQAANAQMKTSVDYVVAELKDQQ